VVEKVVPPKKKKKSCAGKLERKPNPRKVCTMSVNRKSPEDNMGEEFQCYYCGDVSMAREDIIKCLRRHNENGWIAEDRIEIGGDTFEERTIEVRIGLYFFFS
jgi:hypothetical protein